MATKKATTKEKKPTKELQESTLDNLGKGWKWNEDTIEEMTNGLEEVEEDG